MESQKERIIPYSITIIFYVFALHMLKQAPLPPIVFNFLVGATLSIISALIINLKWKISAHMIGVGGLVAALFCVSVSLDLYITPFFILSLLVAGLVGSPRLILKAHTPSQVYVGFATGVICQLIVLYF